MATLMQNLVNIPLGWIKDRIIGAFQRRSSFAANPRVGSALMLHESCRAAVKLIRAPVKGRELLSECGVSLGQRGPKFGPSVIGSHGVDQDKSEFTSLLFCPADHPL